MQVQVQMLLLLHFSPLVDQLADVVVVSHNVVTAIMVVVVVGCHQHEQVALAPQDDPSLSYYW